MTLSMTPAAAEHVQKSLAKRGKGLGLSVHIKPSGCSGYEYVMDYADEIKSTDLVFESHGIKIVTDPQSLELMDGTEVDYQVNGLNAALVFHNPKAQSTCGCGESFNVG